MSRSIRTARPPRWRVGASGNSRKRATAFTLLDVLVTISIIAILAALLLPVFARAMAAAKRISCVSQMRQVYLAISLYAEDLGGWEYPPRTLVETEPYLRDARVYMCPVASIRPGSDGLYDAEIADLHSSGDRSPFPVAYSYIRYWAPADDERSEERRVGKECRL